jgi:hypothetical protein
MDIIATMDDKYNFITDIDNKKYCAIKLKKGNTYKIKVTKSRNVKHNAKYWVLLKALEFHFGNTDTAYHMYFKEMFLEPIVLKLKSGEIKKYPNSTAFDKMNQVEFDDYYNKVDNWLIEHGYEANELINTMEI